MNMNMNVLKEVYLVLECKFKVGIELLMNYSVKFPIITVGFPVVRLKCKLAT